MASEQRPPLDGIRVIDTTDERAPLCARILADLGADVVKVEPPGGAPSRSLPPHAPDGTSLFFATRNTGKRSVTLDLARPEGRARFDDLLTTADVWVDDTRPAELAALDLDPERVATDHPHLVVTAITDFGRSGPYRDYVATDEVMVAISGMLARSGVIGRPPLLPPGELAHDVTAATAAFFALGALWQRLATGRGQVLDVSVMQAVAQITDWSLPNHSYIEFSGGSYDQLRNGSGFIYPLYPCADGYVRLVILSPRQWRAMRAWLGEPPELQDDHWDSVLARMSIQADVLDPMFMELFRHHTAADLGDEAQRRGIVLTPVLKPAEVLALPHFRQRGTFITGEAAAGLTGSVASGFFELDGERLGYRHRSPQPGEHDPVLDALIAAGPQPWPSPTRVDSVLRRAPGEVTRGADSSLTHPFTGLKVVDMGHAAVGVETGRLLAEYGAEVIKIETRAYPDFIRVIMGGEMSASFVSSNRSKRSFGVNAKHEQGLAILHRLIQWADVLIENGSTGTMADLGVSYEVVAELNPGLVMASSQLMGSTGPWKDWIGYGPSTRPAGGMTHLWNFDDGGPPPGSGAIHPDHLAGRLLGVGALAALLGRERHRGRGGHVELAQVEVLINLLADQFLAESLDPGSARPAGNRSQRGAPWGVYQCQGDERWCVITVRHDTDWLALCQALGDPAWARQPELATAAGRRAAHDELDRRIGEWTARHTDREVTTILQAAGVPAGYMAYPADLACDDHSVARGFPHRLNQPPIGELLVEGPALEASRMPPPIIEPAPGLGQHTRQICRQILGLPDDEIDELIAAGTLEIPPAPEPTGA